MRPIISYNPIYAHNKFHIETTYVQKPDHYIIFNRFISRHNFSEASESTCGGNWPTAAYGG
jgi:hypothetical protein